MASSLELNSLSQEKTSEQDSNITGTKTTINKWNLVKLKSFCVGQDTIQAKQQATEWEKFFTSYTFERAVIYNI